MKILNINKVLEENEKLKKQIKDLKKEYSKDLMEEKRNDQYKRK